MLVEHEGRRPTVADSAYVAATAVLCGDVRVGEDARILFGAVLSAEGGPVEVGARCIVMENAVLRGREGNPLVLGDSVLVGPHAHLNGALIEDEVFLATGVSAFPGVRIGRGCEVRVGAVVHVNSTLPEGTTVPIGWIAVGDPAELFPPGAHDELWAVQKQMDFPGTVFGLPREEATMDAVARRYAKRFGRHRGDRVL
ncbi:MAG TPA: gamma carbonic anhydrase family protein [Thermoleophilaceae bacterium]|nr:gamma carbonic anhydrase family protein [Thermoleophilaceae bacterium]